MMKYTVIVISVCYVALESNAAFYVPRIGTHDEDPPKDSACPFRL